MILYHLHVDVVYVSTCCSITAVLSFSLSVNECLVSASPPAARRPSLQRRRFFVFADLRSGQPAKQKQTSRKTQKNKYTLTLTWRQRPDRSASELQLMIIWSDNRLFFPTLIFIDKRFATLNKNKTINSLKWNSFTSLLLMIYLQLCSDGVKSRFTFFHEEDLVNNHQPSVLQLLITPPTSLSTKSSGFSSFWSSLWCPGLSSGVPSGPRLSSGPALPRPGCLAADDSSLHPQHLLVKVRRLHVQQEGEELQQPDEDARQRRLHLRVMTAALPAEKKKKRSVSIPAGSEAQGSKIKRCLGLINNHRFCNNTNIKQSSGSIGFMSLHMLPWLPAYRGLQGLSAGCQYAALEGVRTLCFRVRTPSSFFWCRLGPSAPSSSPQQNLKLDGSARSTPAGREDSFSKQICTCSAIPAQTQTQVCVYISII